MKKSNTLLELYNNKLLFTKVYALLQEEKPYDYILKFLDSNQFTLSKGSLSKLKAKIKEANDTGVSIESLLDKRRKSSIDDIPASRIEGFMGNPNKEDNGLPQENYDEPEPMTKIEKAYSARQILETIMQKGFATIQTAKAVDAPSLQKAIEMYLKYYPETKGLTADALKQYQIINSAVIEAVKDTVIKYIPEDKQAEALKEMDDKTAKIIDEAGATEDGKNLLKQLSKENLTL